jgi:hypothetical protein
MNPPRPRWLWNLDHEAVEDHMSEQGTYKVVPHPRLKRDFIGRTVRTRRQMQNAHMSIPAGTVLQVDDRPRTGARLKSAPCQYCGVSIFISRVEDRDFEFVERRKALEIT